MFVDRLFMSPCLPPPILSLSLSLSQYITDMKLNSSIPGAEDRGDLSLGGFYSWLDLQTWQVSWASLSLACRTVGSEKYHFSLRSRERCHSGRETVGEPKKSVSMGQIQPSRANPANTSSRAQDVNGNTGQSTWKPDKKDHYISGKYLVTTSIKGVCITSMRLCHGSKL